MSISNVTCSFIQLEKIKFAWVTFETTKMRDITYGSLTSTLCEDFCSMICCCCHDKEKMFMKK